VLADCDPEANPRRSDQPELSRPTVEQTVWADPGRIRRQIGEFTAVPRKGRHMDPSQETG